MGGVAVAGGVVALIRGRTGISVMLGPFQFLFGVLMLYMGYRIVKNESSESGWPWR